MPQPWQAIAQRFCSMGIYMDDDLISNPTVNAKITGGKAEITGMSSKEEAQSLSDKINSGLSLIHI